MISKIALLSKLTVGTEIECGIYQGNSRVVGDFVSAKNWRTGHDGSIENLPRNYSAYEFQSPVFTALEAEEKIAEVLAFMNANNTQVNDTCGSHVHIGFGDILDNMPLDEKLAFVGRVLINMASVEAAIFYYSGGMKRMQGRYAQPVGKSTDDMYNALTIMGDRYRAVNISALQSHKTIEFRIFVGTLDAAIYAANVKIALGVIIASLQGKTLPKMGHNESGLRMLEQTFGITPNLLTGMIDVEYVAFRKAVKETRKQGAFSADAVMVWKRYLKVKTVNLKTNASQREGYLRLRRMLSTVESVMTFDNPENDVVIFIVKRTGVNSPEQIRFNQGVLQLTSNDYTLDGRYRLYA